MQNTKNKDQKASDLGGLFTVRLLDFDIIARRNRICILSIFQTISSYLSAQTGLTVRALDFV